MAKKTPKRVDPDAEPDILGSLEGPGKRMVIWFRWEPDDHQVALFHDITDTDGDPDGLWDYKTEGKARARFLKEAAG
jgi:hypothetical protein